LVSLPDGFDEDTSVRLAMFAIASAWGVPIRWIWPATVNGATKADAMYQHIAGLGGGLGRIITVLTMQLGGDPRGVVHATGKFLPPHLKLVFDFQDDEQDEMRAQVQNTRAGIWKVNLETGVYDIRTSREQALAAGDLTQAQFDRQELADGRLPDGSAVIALFQIDNEPFLSWLDLGVDSPLSISDNEPLAMLGNIDAAAITVQDVIANSNNSQTKARAEQALAALGALKAMYAPLAQQAVQQELMAQFGAAETSPETPTEPPTAEKTFNFGAGAGEIIGGELARGAGGRFINIAEMKAQMQAMMLQRMGKGGTRQAKNSAAAKRANNRAAVGRALGLNIETLANMVSGTASAEQEQGMVARGLATQNPDGSISLNSTGRAVLNAANSGDVDAAETALNAPKPGKNKPGKEPKRSPDERRREREQEQERQRNENRQKVADQLGGRLSISAYQSLLSFSGGAEPTIEDAQALAQQGLVELDADGHPRLTSVGTAVVNAANRGDPRAAKDALSKGAEQVRRLLQRADQADTTAEQYDSNAETSLANGEAQALKYVQQAATIQAAIPEIVSPYHDQANSLAAQADLIAGQAAALDTQASEMEARATVLQAQLYQAPTEAVRAVLRNQIDQLQTQAQQHREQAQANRDQTNNLRTQSLDLHEKGRAVQADLEERARTSLTTADLLRQQAGEQAKQWRERATQAREQARLWRNSTGNAMLHSTPFQTIKRWLGREKATDPSLPTPADIEQAIRHWDANPDLPPQAKGLLRAKRKPGTEA